jgi:hypothetical protein
MESLVGCYAMPAAMAAPFSALRSDPGASVRAVPDHFSIHADTTADGMVRHTIRPLDPTGVESGIVSGLSWRYASGVITIVGSENLSDRPVSGEQPILTVTGTPAGPFIAAPGRPAIHISRILQCTRVHGGG